MNQTGHCYVNHTVEVMNCDGHMLYRFWGELQFYFIHNVYICFDRIYDDTCKNLALPLPAGPVNNSVSIVQINWGDLELGWYDSVYGGKNYTIPLIKDVNSVSEMCYGKHNAGIYIQGKQPVDVGETPVGMRVCVLSDYDYDMYYQDNDYNNYQYYCDYHVFIRSCNGKLQLDLSLSIYQEDDICLVRAENVKVIPGIRHTVQNVEQEGKLIKFYKPYLQYRCSFQMTEADMYKVKWYINGVFLTEKGPANDADELVLKEGDLNDSKLGYTVKCSVVVVLRKRSVTDVFDSSSEEFFAGYKVSDSTIELSKTGTVTASVEQTVPIGCSYNDDSPANCLETLALDDLNLDQNKCSDGVNSVNAYDTSLHSHTIKSLKLNEEWIGSTSYQYKLSTVDRTYDDRNSYTMNIQLNGVKITDGQNGDIQVNVKSWDYSRNKMCYSHVDPHMRTGNLRKYEQQREGDYMLYRNKLFQTEVQERARRCGSGKPVCACAVIVRAGGDAFMIDRCDGPPYEIEFIQCNDCGILDVVKISDSQYEIYTPARTKISVKLLNGWANGRNMNIDIYLMVKDFGNTDGLCGKFDNTSANDFTLRIGQTTDDANTFADDWRLKPKENLFKNPNRKLDKWREYIKKCHREGSISAAKCSKINNSCSAKRKKRATERKTLKLKTSRGTSTNIYRTKRSVVTNITESEAEQICRDAIYSAPAVLEFPDKLADEDLENVIDQCVYDVVQGNDVSWAEAHVVALDNIAINILNLNPVFKSNNSDLVKTFLSHTCVHNCSGNGICSNDGLCNCTGVYRGYDCSIDRRIPPLIYDIRNGGICSSDDEDECTCFIIKTENIFEGFHCDIKTFKMSFNGEREEVGNSRRAGEYDDEYTGECCVPNGRRKRSETDIETGPFIYAYDITISNDGINFGDISPVYMYDTACLYLEEKDEVFVGLKDGYCFIDDTCINTSSTHQTGSSSECLVCDPHKNKYTWTTADCSKRSSGLSTPALIGIIIGSTLAALIAAFVIIYCVCCKSSKRVVAVDIDSTEIGGKMCPETELANIPHTKRTGTTNAVDKNAKTTFDLTTIIPDITTSGTSKPVFKTVMSNVSQTISVKEAYVDGQELQTGDYMSNHGNIAFSNDSESRGPESSPVKDTHDQTFERGLSAVSLKID
ncbi:uncharacterized protein LOC123542290 isoform X2 [Mercenaria mercenaria]|nr:uncharacterized protein LOC123542290 isoform X2 [Mercenaria mercenaria]